MLKKWITMLLCLLVIASFSACGSKKQENKPDESSEAVSSTDQTNQSDESPLKVYVTFNAMKEFVTAVGKDKVEVATIIPDGMEPHDFEPKAQDIAGLSSAKIFVYSGLGMEAWAEEAIKAADNTDLIIVEASKGADVIENTDQEEIEEHGQYDPHIWLSLKGAESEVKNIKDALVQADPSNKDYYEANCDDFISQLEDLYNEYNEKFQSVEKRAL